MSSVFFCRRERPRRTVEEDEIMNRIVKKVELAPEIKLFEIEASSIARKVLPGHFVVVRAHEKGERIPLTIADARREEGILVIVFQEVGKSTKQMGLMAEGN